MLRLTLTTLKAPRSGRSSALRTCSWAVEAHGTTWVLLEILGALGALTIGEETERGTPQSSCSHAEVGTFFAYTMSVREFVLDVSCAIDFLRRLLSRDS